MSSIRMSVLKESLYLVGTGLRQRSRFASAGLLLVLTLAAGGMVAGQTVKAGSHKALDALAAESNAGHFVLRGRPATIENILDSQPDIAEAGQPFAQAAVELVATDGVRDLALVVQLTETPTTVGRLILRQGRLPSTTDPALNEVVVEPEVGQIGETLKIQRLGVETTLKVVGIAIDFNQCGSPTCRPGRLFLSTPTFTRIAGDPRTTDQAVALRVKDSAQAFASKLAASGGETRSGETKSGATTLESHYAPVHQVISGQQIRSQLLAPDDFLGGFATGLGGFMLLGALVIVFSTVSAQMVARQREMAILGTIGATTKQLIIGAIGEQLLFSTGASLLGWVVGSLAAPLARASMARSLGWGGPEFQLRQLIIVFTVLTTLMVAVTAKSVIRNTRQSISNSLRQDVIDGKPIARWAQQLPGLIPGLGIQEVLSRKLRSISAVLAIALAVSGSLTVLTLRETLWTIAKPQNQVSDKWDLAFWSMTSVQTDQLAAEVEAVSGVRSTHTSLWRYGQLQNKSKQNKDQNKGQNKEQVKVTIQGGDPLSDSVNIVTGRNALSAGESVIATRLARRHGLRLGDPIEFTLDGHRFSTVVVGTFRDFGTGNALRFRLEQLRQVEPGARAGSLQIRLHNNANKRQVLGQIQQQLGARAQGFGSRGFDSEVKSARLALLIIGGLLVLLAAGQAGSSWLIGVRENARELSLMQAIGFTPRQLGSRSMVGAGLVGVAGWLVGLPLGRLANSVISMAALQRAQLDTDLALRPSAAIQMIMGIGAVVTYSIIGRLATQHVARASVDPGSTSKVGYGQR